jgi:4-carboxymuconolactone decarboxylase
VDEKVYDTGMSIRRDVLGAEYVDNAMASADDFNIDFQKYVTEYCWGACWGRDALDRKQRSLINISMLAALGRWEEFELHFNGALNNGCSLEQIKDALFHVAVYAGIPAGVSAFKNARRILKEREAKS